MAMAKQAALRLGHQPVAGRNDRATAAFRAWTCQVRKGAVWWLRTRERDGHEQTVPVAAQSPDRVYVRGGTG